PAGSPPTALHTLLPLLPPLHAKFFELLDFELEKVDSFYAEREKELRDRGKLLKEQLNELGLHRKKYYVSFWATRAHSCLTAILLAIIQCHTEKSDDSDQPELEAAGSYRGGMHLTSLQSKGATEWNADLVPAEIGHSITTGDGGNTERKFMSPLPASTAGYSTQVASLKSNRPPTKANGNVQPRNNNAPFTSPQEYQNAKKRLKKAVVEYYRGLEALNNYRILNLTGFRKAVKKYEKVTQVPAQAAYMKERVEPSAFASGAMVSSMLKETEDLFAARFERGDKKKAITHLRVGATQKSHHFSTFRTGLWLGSSIPATITGLIACALCQRHSTRISLHSWDIILFIYSILLIPTLLALLVVISFAVLPIVWRTSTLLGVSTPDTFLMFLPIPMCRLSPSRQYAKTFQLAVVPRFSSSQTSSLMPRDSPIWSAYDPAVQDAWTTCGTQLNWGSYFVLAMIPFVVRLVQSLRRYKDSKLPTHLINVSLQYRIVALKQLTSWLNVQAGKYGMGIVYYFCYYLWRRDGKSDNGASFILWCISAIIYSIYGCAWDFAMDWSICKPHAKYPFLRKELVYTSQIPMYYVALVTNTIIRFLWVFYIPDWPYFNTRSFLYGLMEMIRRVVWNFYRLENEHLGNMDQYRITREVPLPYSFDIPQHEDDDDEDKA
ncbi:EXS family-domain-containing protein, partial [Suillus occidentalis]